MLLIRRVWAVLVALMIVGACFVLPASAPQTTLPAQGAAGSMAPLRFAHEAQPLDCVARPSTSFLPEPSQAIWRQAYVHVALAALLALLTLLFSDCVFPERIKPLHIIVAFCHALRAPPAFA